MEIGDKIYLIFFIFSLVLVYNHDLSTFTDIADIGSSNAAADDFTN